MKTLKEATERLRITNRSNLTIIGLKETLKQSLEPFLNFNIESADEGVKKAIYSETDPICEAYSSLILEDYNFRKSSNNQNAYLHVSEEETKGEFVPFVGNKDALDDKWVAILQMQGQGKIDDFLTFPIYEEEKLQAKEHPELAEKNNCLYYEMIKGLPPKTAKFFLEYMSRKKQVYDDLIPFILMGNYAVDFYLHEIAKENQKKY